MKKLLTVCLVLASVMATAKANAQTSGIWWSAPITSSFSQTQLTVNKAGDTVFETSHIKFVGNIYVNLANNLNSLTLCGVMGPNDDDVEIDIVTPAVIITDHTKRLQTPETLVAIGWYGGMVNHSTSDAAWCMAYVTGTYTEGDSDNTTKVSLKADIKCGQIPGKVPTQYLFDVSFSKSLSSIGTTGPTCWGETVPYWPLY